MENIAQLQINKLLTRLKDRNITVIFQKDVAKYIAEKGYVKEFGARPIQRAVQEYIMVPLSQYLLKYPDTKELKVSVMKDNIIFE